VRAGRTAVGTRRSSCIRRCRTHSTKIPHYVQHKPKLRETYMQEDSYLFNPLVVPTAHNQLRFVKDRNGIHPILDDRCLDTMPVNVAIPYLHLEMSSLQRLNWPHR
jgi:hypothetical protein